MSGIKANKLTPCMRKYFPAGSYEMQITDSNGLFATVVEPTESDRQRALSSIENWKKGRAA